MIFHNVIFSVHQRVIPSLLQSISHGFINILPRNGTHWKTGWFFPYTYKIYSIYQPILWNLAISLLQLKHHKQHNQTVLRDSIVRIHILFKINRMCYGKRLRTFWLTLVSLLGEGRVVHLNKLESSSPKDDFCKVWQKLAQWFWRQIFKNFTTTTDKAQMFRWAKAN